MGFLYGQNPVISSPSLSYTDADIAFRNIFTFSILKIQLKSSIKMNKNRISYTFFLHYNQFHQLYPNICFLFKVEFSSYLYPGDVRVVA